MKVHGSITLAVFVPTIFACAMALGKDAGPEQKPQKPQVKSAPFRIPALGKPDDLIGGIQYEGPSAFAFDSRNRPYFLHTFKNKKDDKRPDLAGVISTCRDGKWNHLSFKSAIQEVAGDFKFSLNVHGLGSITFDADDDLYLISQTTKGVFLVYSSDFGKTFQAYKLPAKNWCGAFLETHTGHNLKKGAPAIGVLYDLGKKKVSKWSTLAKLSIIVPEKKAGRLVLQAVEVTSKCFGISNHSGGYSFAATVGNLTHVVYAEYDPAIKGNPTWVATFDRTSRKVVARKHLFNAHPGRCDVHSTPVITADSQGHLHILGGAHNGPFLYTRSITSNSATGGWTKPAPMHRGQTYVTLVCDKNDVLHSVYRVHPNLIHQSKPVNAAKWSKPRTLVRAPKGHSGYTCFYHQLILDRLDAQYVCFTFVASDRQAEKNKATVDYPRALITSKDHGVSWGLVRTNKLRLSTASKTERPNSKVKATR